MRNSRATLEDVRGFYARMMAAASGSTDPRLERIFEMVPREAFLPPGPWHVEVGGQLIETPGADPALIYQNVLVALDRTRRINNGEPFLHAQWLGAVSPQPGEHVVHVGAGTGYYTAILAMLVLEGGTVTGFEIEPALAEAARDNLEPFENVEIVRANAVENPPDNCDILYVNASVIAPPVGWLEALAPGGRLIFPWQPTRRAGIAVLVTRLETGFSARMLGPSWFIPCVGASDPSVSLKAPDLDAAWRSRSIVLASDRPPDETATAVYRDLWFSSETADR